MLAPITLFQRCSSPVNSSFSNDSASYLPFSPTLLHCTDSSLSHCSTTLLQDTFYIALFYLAAHALQISFKALSSKQDLMEAIKSKAQTVLIQENKCSTESEESMDSAESSLSTIMSWFVLQLKTGHVVPHKKRKSKTRPSQKIKTTGPSELFSDYDYKVPMPASAA